jgi:hypothetical protein
MHTEDEMQGKRTRSNDRCGGQFSSPELAMLATFDRIQGYMLRGNGSALISFTQQGKTVFFQIHADGFLSESIEGAAGRLGVRGRT